MEAMLKHGHRPASSHRGPRVAPPSGPVGPPKVPYVFTLPPPELRLDELFSARRAGCSRCEDEEK